MFTNAKPPETEEEAKLSFKAAWEAAERAVATHGEVERFLAKWDKLSDEARATINHAAQYEFGDDLDVGDALRRATFGWTRQQNREELRADAFRVLVLWWEKKHDRPARAWRKETGNSAFTDWAVATMRECGAATTEGKIEGLMRRLGRVENGQTKR